MRHCTMIIAVAAIAGCQPTEPGDSATGTTTSDTGSSDAPETTGTPTTGEPAGTTTSAATTGTATTAAETTSGPADTTGPDPTTGFEDTTGPALPEPWAPKGCPEIFAQELLPTFEIDITPAELKKLEDEWHKGDDHNTPEHPVRFQYEDIVINDASVRLRGNATWWPGQGKMQLEISFNTYNKKGRFMGLKHIALDAAEYNRSFLRDRLAMQILRDVGVPAPCANNARLLINGEYYGLFTSIEKVDSEFLERYFEDPDGNLYKCGGSWSKKTNEEDPSMDDLETLLKTKSIAQLEARMNLDEAILEWATEAVMPDNDGAWAGGLNLYLYNDPLSGFVVIPWDKDATFERLPHDVDPVKFKKDNFKGRPLYDLALSDPEWYDRYIDALAFVLERGYDVATLQQRIDTWAAQIADAVADDPNKPFTLKNHQSDVKELREYVAKRHAFVAKWLE